MKSENEVIRTVKWYKSRWDLETKDVMNGKMKNVPPHGLGYYAGIVSALDWVSDYKWTKEKSK